MDTSSIGIARTIFVSALLPGDRQAPDFSPKSAVALAKQLNRTFNICSVRNVQLCKNSIVNSVLPSPARTAALLKYLVAASKSFGPRPADHKISERSSGMDDLEGLEPHDGQFSPPRSAAKRLHVVYLIHDMLVTLHSWQKSQQIPSQLKTLDIEATLLSLTPQAVRLVQLAACRGDFRADEVKQPLSRLMGQWRRMQVLSPEILQSLTAVVTSAAERTWDQALEECAREDEKRATEKKQAQEEAMKWILPFKHGVKDDPDAPWHELPAANGLYMKNTRGYPLHAVAFPKGGFELKYGGLEADQDLKKEVSWLHKEVLHCFDEYTNADEIQDVDTLGNRVWGDTDRPTRNYWGFTSEGIEKARENSKRFREQAIGYGDMMPWMSGANTMPNVNAAVQRARALAEGRGGFDMRGGRGRGGRGGGTGWRGPPRGGGNGYRGGRGGPPGRYY